MANKMTYGRLSKLLTSLGFERIEHAEYFVVQNTDFDALIALPRGDDAAVVSPIHMQGIEQTLTGKGVVSSIGYKRLFNVPRRRSAPRVVRVKINSEPGTLRLQHRETTTPRSKAHVPVATDPTTA